jgi:hypothetical protein
MRPFASERRRQNVKELQLYSGNLLARLPQNVGHPDRHLPALGELNIPLHALRLSPLIAPGLADASVFPGSSIQGKLEPSLRRKQVAASVDANSLLFFENKYDFKLFNLRLY